MRVLQAMCGAEHGGAEKFFVNLVLALSRAGLCQQVLLAPNPIQSAKLADQGLHVRQIFGTPGDAHMRFRFLAAIGEYQPDVVLTWMTPATYFCPRFESTSGLKKFIHVARLGGYYNLKYYDNCDYLIGNTPALVDYFQSKGWSKERTMYVPNFTNVPDSSARAARRADYQTPEDVPLALALGRFHENKAFDTLIRAVKKTPQLHLWIAGDEGSLKSEIQELVSSLDLNDRVRILGWHEDVTPLFLAADLFVCSSRHEPLGNVILESWAHRVPVVATASPGPEQLIINELNGLLSPVDDPDTLALSMQRIINDSKLSESLAVAGFETVQENYSEPAVVHAYLQFFESIVRRSNECA